MTPIHALVFSKGRAMQLDALLRSMERYAPVDSIRVLLADETEGDPSYQTLIAEWMYRGWLPEGRAVAFVLDRAFTFEGQVRAWLEGNERVVFHTDDELYFAHPPAELLELDNSDTILTLRQGRNTVWCHPLSCAQPVPDVFPWKWREAQLDFAYPISLNATVYNSRDLLPLLDFHFSNPTQLEACWAANAARLEVEWMTAPERSCTVALPHNVTSVSSGNPRGDWPDYQPEALRQFYMEGWRIDPFALDYSLVDAAHVELPLVFERPA